MIDSLKTYIIDILSILVPGGLLIAVLAQFSDVTNTFLEFFPRNDEKWINAVVWIGTAYTLGHFIFFIGSFLDDWIFEKVKRVFYTNHSLTAHIISYKIEKTGIEDGKVINAFKWSCAWLLANKPDMYSVVERHIAESKFFRSLVVVLLIALITLLTDAYLNYALIATLLLLIILSIIRYLTQREKSIETAYHSVITASDRIYSSAEIQPIISRLNEKNISPCQKLPESSIAVKLWFLKLYCGLRKVLVVMGLCLNPFRKTDKHDV